MLKVYERGIELKHSELIDAIVEKTGAKKSEVVRIMGDQLVFAMRNYLRVDNDLNFVNLGVFERKNIAARTYKNDNINGGVPFVARRRFDVVLKGTAHEL